MVEQLNIHVGTSGYSYDDWKGNWYPKSIASSKMLEFYAKRFPCVELNFSYYRIPTRKTTESMVRKTSDEFLFTLKAHQSFTHEREPGEEEFTAFRDGTAPLAESGKLGALLLQFPFSFKESPENRDYLLRLRDRFQPWPQVVEFRHRSWYAQEVFDLLKREEISLCCVDEPNLPGLLPRLAMATGPVGYVRFHGRNSAKWWKHEEAEERYDYNYTQNELSDWIPKIKDLANKATTTFVFFNNHVNGQAPSNAELLMALLGLPLVGRSDGGEGHLF